MRPRIKGTMVLWNLDGQVSDGRRRPQRDRSESARSILENGPSTAAALAERLALTPAAVRRHLDHLIEEGRSRPASPASTAPAAEAVRPRSSRSPTPAATASTSSTTTWPSRRCASSPRRGATTPSRSSPGAGSPSSRRDYRRSSPADPGPSPRGGAGPGPHPGRLRRLRPAGSGRRAAVPAALPGRPRRARVPAAVRGGDRGDRQAARTPRPAAGHHRPRRRGLHHLHPDHDHDSTHETLCPTRGLTP